jgi:putative sterol carrier protein
MSTYHDYLSQEWLEYSFEAYQTNAHLQDRLKKVTHDMVYRIMANPEWGIDNDLYFALDMKAGVLSRLAYTNKEDAQKADFIVAGSPKEWIDIMKDKTRFIARFMMSELKLDMGDRLDVIRLAPYVREMVKMLTQVEVHYPDDMSPEEIETYRAKINKDYASFV